MRKKMISLMMTVAMGTVMISGATVVKADSDEKETVVRRIKSCIINHKFMKH
jgi:raffinose/stachyose/melibiose transport system substrate-binding protein